MPSLFSVLIRIRFLDFGLVNSFYPMLFFSHIKDQSRLRFKMLFLSVHMISFKIKGKILLHRGSE